MRHGYRNGNYTVLIDDRNGTKVRYTKDGKFVPKFAESIDVTLTYQCDGGCPFCYADCTPDGKHANLMSDSIMELVDSLAPFTELALNGNDLSIPHLEDFLRILKKKHIFANLTVNQKHFTVRRRYRCSKEQRLQVAYSRIQAKGQRKGIFQSGSRREDKLA